ncbi:MAG: hypothetical protein ACR2N2_08400 [Acidimicrobiia bacterium]
MDGYGTCTIVLALRIVERDDGRMDMWGIDTDDAPDAGRKMIKTIAYTFAAFVVVAILIVVAQNV